MRFTENADVVRATDSKIIAYILPSRVTSQSDG